MSVSINLEQVSKSFEGGESVLHELSLDVRPSEIVALVGPSGCGKSTLLRLLSGLDRDHTGRLLIDGREVAGPNRQVGFMFQEPRLLPWLNVRANVAFGLPGSARKQAGPALSELLRQVQLEDAQALLPRQLSGGMAQRAALARALAVQPGVLLLDEPFSAVDAFTRMHLQELLLSVWQRAQFTMLLVTHDIDEALYLGDRVVVLTSRPASVSEVMSVALPRPRDRRHPELLRLRSHLLEELRLAGAPEARVEKALRTGTPFSI
jgi:sulfonate transport system ATP-binding protein